MKHLLLIGFALVATLALKAQTTNLIFFTEQGERFSIVLNGILQNESPQTNILVTDLPAPNYKVKVIFEDKKLGEIDKNLFLNQGTESTYVIKKNNKGEYIVRFMNDVPLAEAPAPTQTQSVVVYHTEPINTTTTTTVVNNNPSGGGIGFNVQDPVSGANINMNVNLGGMGMQTSTSTSTTTTTTTSSSGNTNISTTHYDDHGMGDNDGERHHEHHNQGTYVLQGYSGPYGCPMPMAPGDFESAKKTISTKSFEDSKLTIAKQIIQSNCLLSSQVREIMLLFSFEDTRLTFAKFAYAYTLDLGNYYKVNDAFTFESSIDDLNKYIEGYRK